MTNASQPTREEEFERAIQEQLLEYEQMNLKPRLPTKEDVEMLGLFSRIVLISDVLDKAGIVADGNDTDGKVEAAIKTIASTSEGVAWIKERLKSFPR